MIISCYPGVGKTTISNKRIDIIDLDSSIFSQYSPVPVDMEFEYGIEEKNRIIDRFWPDFYIKVAEKLSQGGYIVLISSDKIVRDRLLESNEDFCFIIPDKELKDEWIEKLRVRWENSGSEKDLRAYTHVKDHYNKDISRISAIKYSCPICLITNMDYDLERIIGEAEEKLKFFWTGG